MKIIQSIVISFILSTLIDTVLCNEVRIKTESPAEPLAGESFPVFIEIQKNSLKGFAKLEVFFPVGFKPESAEAKNATCIIQNELLKLIWIELPEDSKITVNITVTVDRRISGYKEVYGNFHYISDKTKKKTSIGVIPFLVKNEFKDKPSEFPVKADRPEFVHPEKFIDQKTVYRVQIAAFSKKISKNILLELCDAQSFINEEPSNGLYRYTVGDFKSKDDANIYRHNCGIKGAFIVVYENGKRISGN